MDRIKSLEKALKLLLDLKKAEGVDLENIANNSDNNVKTFKRYINTFNAVGIEVLKEGKVYKLKDDKVFVNEIKIDDNQMKVLILCYDLLRKNGIHNYADKVQSLINDFKNYNRMSSDEIKSSEVLLMGAEEEKKDEVFFKNFREIESAINESCVLSIDYEDSNGKVSETRWVYPLILVNCDGSLYLKSFCLKAKDYRDFKLIRIRYARKIDKKFNKDDYPLSDLGKALGFITTGEEYDLKLKIKKPIATTIMEKHWNADEKKYWDDEYLIYEAKVKGDIEIFTWILSMKDCVTILQPEVLRVKVKDMLKKMIENI